MTWGGMACVVLIADAEIVVAERHPDPFSRPADMHQFSLIRHPCHEGAAGFGRVLGFKPCAESEGACLDDNFCHAVSYLVSWFQIDLV